MKQTENNLSDSELVGQIIKGEAAIFGKLLSRYQNHVVGIVSKHLPHEFVEETAHDIFVRAYQALPGYKNKGSFKKWLSSIALRTCCDFWRKNGRSPEVPISSLSEQNVDWLEGVVTHRAGEDVWAHERRQEARELLDWALTQLAPADRMVLELLYLQGLTGQETAELLGCSVANVKIRSFRARNKLKTVLQKVVNGSFLIPSAV